MRGENGEDRKPGGELQSHQGIGILQGALRRGARLRTRRPAGKVSAVALTHATVALAFYQPGWQFYFPCRQVNRFRLEMVQTACQSNVVYAVIAGTVTAYKEPG